MNKAGRLVAGAALALPGLFCHAVTATSAVLSEAGRASVILADGRIYTPDGIVEAIAVNDSGVIIGLGETEEIKALRGTETTVIDLAGNAVLPGFHDLHVHPLFAGLRDLECSIPQGSTLEEIQAIVRSCVQSAGKDEWIAGGQWDASAIGGIPTSQMLDVVAPRNPVLLYDTSGHSAWVNSRALEIAGISRETADPEGGIIERDAAGQPSGALRESAIELVRSKIPPAPDEEVRAALTRAANLMLSFGITSFTEASTGFAAGAKELPAYAALADAGVLKQRVRLCLNWAPDDASAEGTIAARALYTRERVTTDCVKIFLDGVPTDSHTAAMLEPYAGAVQGRDDEASRYGLLLVEQRVLNEAVSRFDRMGLTVKFHAAGDAAVRAGLKAIHAARRANGWSGQLHDVGHCTFVAKGDLALAPEIGATFEVSPYLWAPSPINDDITRAVGPERIERVWPVREMLDAGALVVPGSDWAVVPSVNPWIGVETLVTRERPGGSEDSFGRPQAITVEEAIAMYTMSAAKHMDTEDRLGRIELGMLADVIVLDQDPYNVPATRLHETTVLMTIINGEVVYERP